MRHAIAIAALVLGSLTFSPARADAPTFPAEAKVKILRLQRDRANLIGEYRQCQARMKEIEAQVPVMDQQVELAVDEAYKAAKVEKKDWLVDREKLEFVAVAKGAGAGAGEKK